MENDVDPATMPLSEIYQQPEAYFEPLTGSSPRIDHLGISHTLYGGVRSKQHGYYIFNIKDDDDKGGNHKYCSMCNSTTIDEHRLREYWKHWSQLGEEETSQWRHP